MHGIYQFDLNLLTVFVAVDEHRHITKAAKTLRISQPAVSHALGRLRALLDDPLFVKSSQGMVPTPRAVELAPSIRSLLASFERDVLGKEAFEPMKLKRTFIIFTTDYVESLLLPRLLDALATEAPGVRVACKGTRFSFPRAELESECDLAIAGFFGELPDGFYQQKLFSDEFVSAVRKGHPRLGKKRELTLDEFCAERHLLIAPGGELQATMDGLLKKKKRERFIVAGLSAFMSSAWILPETDCVLTGSARLIRQIGKAFPIQVLVPPVKVPDITIVQVWHERNHRDPGHRWFREQVMRALQLP